MLIDFSAANTGRCRDEKRFIADSGNRDSAKRSRSGAPGPPDGFLERDQGESISCVAVPRRTWLHPNDPFHPIDPHYQGFDLRISRPISSRYSAMRQDIVVNSTIRVSDGKESQCPSGFDAPRHTWTFVANGNEHLTLAR